MRRDVAVTTAACALLSVAFVPVVGFGAIYPYLVEAYGSGHELPTFTIVAFWIATGLASLPVGSAVGRAGFALVVAVGAVVMALGFVVAATFDSQVGAIVGVGVAGGVGSAALGSVTNFAAIGHFIRAPRSRALAVGVGAAGMGASVVVIPPVAIVVETAGIGAAFLFLGAWVLVLSAPCVVCYAVLERRQANEDLAERTVNRSVSWSRRAATRTKVFWWLCLAAVAAPAAFQVMLVHQIEIIQEFGGSYRAGVTAATLMGLISIGVRIGASILARTIGEIWTYAVAVVTSILGISVLAVDLAGLGWPWRAYVYAALFSAGYGTFAPLFPSASLHLFGSHSFGAIHGLLYGGLGAGAAIGAWIGGWLRDLTGSYQPALLFVGVALLVSSVFYSAAAGRIDPAMRGLQPMPGGADAV
jgi:MFS family permease